MADTTSTPTAANTTSTPASTIAPAKPVVVTDAPKDASKDTSKEAHEHKHGLRPSMVQAPLEVAPGEAGAAAINAAEADRLRVAREQHNNQNEGKHTAATLAEMEAGREALKRNKPRAQQMEAANATTPELDANGDPVTSNAPSTTKSS
jgi:hypothetical protein